MRISDWGSDVCSSDLEDAAFGYIFCAKPGVDQWVGIEREAHGRFFPFADRNRITTAATDRVTLSRHENLEAEPALIGETVAFGRIERQRDAVTDRRGNGRSEERRVGKEGVSTCRSRWSR